MQNNYPVSDIKLLLDTNIILIATISCTIYLLPLQYTKSSQTRKTQNTPTRETR